MVDAFIGRQPIFDCGLEIFAYELLFRASEDNRADIVDVDQATSQVILNTAMAIGLDQIVGDQRAFINLSRGFLLDDNPLPFPRDKVGLEILEDTVVDAPLLEGIKRLAAQGYLVALDDFVYHETLRPLIELADVVKIDIRALDRDTVRDHVRELRGYSAKLLAEKVETQEELAFCRELGFDYFQGYFLCRPNVVKGRRVPANRLATLKLLGELENPDTGVGAIESIIREDLSLSYKLLRYINSAAFSLAQPVESIRHAVVLLGHKAIKRWATLLALADIDDKPHALITTAMVRAKMSEELARSLERPNPEVFFTTGLFSALDALMDLPMEEVLQSLPLSEALRAALLRREGMLGETLACTIAYEQGDWEHVTCPGLSDARIADAYLTAIGWADQMGKELVARH